MKKIERQRLIKQVVRENELSTQEELLAELDAAGMSATQATISRDIRELGIKKHRKEGSETSYYIVQNDLASQTAEDELSDAVAATVERISVVEFMVIIQTYLGSANLLAAIIDDLKMPEIAGTLAGANTLAIITHHKDEADMLADKLSVYIKKNDPE